METVRTALKVLLVIAVLLLAGAGYFFYRVSPKIPERPFERPTGPYGVGTREFDWTDSSRAEPYTTRADDRRRLTVQVWYPVAPGTAGDTAKYLLRPSEFASRLGARAARHARTNSLLDAPIATDTTFPVLVYNHGGAWTRWSATFAAEWLASHGYVVFSIEHFGFNQTVAFASGEKFAADTLRFPTETGDGKKDALTSWGYLDDPVFKIWTADAKFVLDQIERQQVAGPFQGRLDLDRIGMYGWSFGGAASIQMTADDPRVKAAVDHDGQLFGDIRERGTSRPILQLHHGVDDALEYPEDQKADVRELLAVVGGWDSTAKARSTADWHNVTITGTTHGDFSDLSLFYPRPEGHLDPRRAHMIINRYTLAFFDRYLRGVPSDLLTTSPFPEATLVTRYLQP